MRLSTHDRTIIKETAARHLQGAEVYLFGSRVNDQKRGGDIDLLVIGRQPISRRELFALRLELMDKLGEQKIDLLYEVDGALTTFAQLVMLDARAI